MSKMKLTIDEVIEHCERKVKSYHNSLDMDTYIAQRGLDSLFVKEYLEHKQVAEWLKELKQLRGAMERITGIIEDYMEDAEHYGFASALQDLLNAVKEEGGIE